MTAEVLAGELVPAAAGGELAIPVAGPVADLVGKWLVEVCGSAATFRAYRGDIKGWFEWLAGGGVEPLAARREHVAAWRRVLEATPTARTGRPLARASVARRIATVASFYAYAHDEGHVERVPVTKRMRPSVPAVSSTVGLSRDEARAFLARLADERPVERAIMRTLLLEGMRVGELTGLAVGSMRPNGGQITVTVVGKGGRRRELVCAAPVVEALDEYLTGRAAAAGMPVGELDQAAPLFATVAGGRYTQRSVMRIVQRIARAAGIRSHRSLSPHSLRHACATLMLDDGQPIHVVRDQLGHASGDTTMRYDRARGSLGRGAAAVHGLAAYLAPDTG